MTKISPSLLAANFYSLEKDLADVYSYADYLHIDVMDGHFVSNISFGFPIMKSVREKIDIPFDVHLMIEEPDRYIDQFIESGAHILTVHYETCPHVHRTLSYIKSKGIQAGIAINPGTPVSVLKDILHIVDLVLVMTVNPGFGGQSFIEETIPKIKQLHQLKLKHSHTYEIEVDGGINKYTAKLCIDAGATILVAGSAIFGQPNRKRAISEILQKSNHTE